jgi:hypothetical protein
MRKEIRKVSQRNLVFILTINSTNYWRCNGSVLRPLRGTLRSLRENEFISEKYYCIRKS